MFGLFKTDSSIRREFVEAQNNHYRINGFKAKAILNGDSFKVIWDLKYMADKFGMDVNSLELEIKNSNSIFPDSSDDLALKRILIDNKFEVYELYYQTQDKRLLRLHKTNLV